MQSTSTLISLEEALRRARVTLDHALNDPSSVGQWVKAPCLDASFRVVFGEVRYTSARSDEFGIVFEDRGPIL